MKKQIKIELDPYQLTMLIRMLNKERNERLQTNCPTEMVNEILMKMIKAQNKCREYDTR